jgi:hypothetical protein
MTGAGDRFSRLESLLGQGGDDLQSLERLCVGSVQHLSMSGAGISVVMGSGHREIVLTTDRVSAQIEELQLSLGEGPCIDAGSQRAPILEADLVRSTPGRWPVFGPAALAAGAAAVFALPLQVGQTHVGALDVYRDTPGGLTRADLNDALRLGDAMTQVLLKFEPAPLDMGSAAAEGGPPFTAEVYQAAGMITVQLDVDITQALARLRAYAYAEERPLRDVARDVVARRLRLERDG